jgi:hypothetical protein
MPEPEHRTDSKAAPGGLPLAVIMMLALIAGSIAVSRIYGRVPDADLPATTVRSH